MTQEQRVLSALKIAGDKGINSYTAREELHIIQLPARVWGLKAKGHLITERTNPDKSVTYFLLQEYKPRVKVEEQTYRHEYFFGNSAGFHEGVKEYCEVCNPQPRQEVMFNG